MRIVLVIKPYAIEVYSLEHSMHTLIGVEEATRIEDENNFDYEKRIIFICKGLCSDMRESSYFKEIAKKVEGIDIILCAPWCVYDAVQVEKDFGKPIRVDQNLITSMNVRKEKDDIQVIESYTSNIQLNGYPVTTISGQMAQTVQFQHIHIYSHKPFVSSMIKMLESVFHTHKVSMSSLYGLTEKMSALREKTYNHELRIIVEEESIDVSYISEGMHVVNAFVPHSYKQLENTIACSLSASPEIVNQILKSRYETLMGTADKNIGKNAKKLWPDLDNQTKELVDTSILESIDEVVKSIRDCVDTINAEYTKDSVSVHVYCLNKQITEAYGYELALKVHEDPYIIMKIHVSPDPVTVKNIF